MRGWWDTRAGRLGAEALVRAGGYAQPSRPYRLGGGGGCLAVGVPVGARLRLGGRAGGTVGGEGIGEGGRLCPTVPPLPDGAFDYDHDLRSRFAIRRGG